MGDVHVVDFPNFFSAHGGVLRLIGPVGKGWMDQGWGSRQGH